MEHLQIWLGLKERESVLQIRPSETADLSEFQRPVRQKEDDPPQSNSPRKRLTSPGLEEDDPPLSNSTRKRLTSPGLPEDDDHIAETHSASKPKLVDGVSESLTSFVKGNRDCATCRVIGSSVTAGAGGYVLFEGWRNRNMYTGFKRFCYGGFCLSLSTSLLATSVSLAFKLGLYQEVSPGEKKDVLGLLKKEYQTLKDRVSSVSPSSAE